jgi:alkylhydroperoxidase family enzyme
LAGGSFAVARALAQRDLDAAEAAGLEPELRRLMDFVEYCVKYPWRIGDEFLDELRGLGFSDEQIAEAAMNVGFFLFMTTMADLYRVPPLESDYLGDDIEAWEAAGAEHQPPCDPPS